MAVRLPTRPRLPMVGMSIFSIMLDQVSTVFSGQEQLTNRSRGGTGDTWCVDTFMETLEGTEAGDGGMILIKREHKSLWRRGCNNRKIL